MAADYLPEEAVCGISPNQSAVSCKRLPQYSFRSRQNMKLKNVVLGTLSALAATGVLAQAVLSHQTFREHINAFTAAPENDFDASWHVRVANSYK